MGVPKFYRWMSERYPSLSQIIKENQIPEFDNLYLDMNGIIHSCSHPNDDDVHFRISEEKIFEDIFRYIDFLFRMIKPQKVFFMAIDGVAPRAKMNQQRGRRFRSAKEAETREAEAKRRGEILPKEQRFDSNCITPGTEFMDKLHNMLKYFVTKKMSSDVLWRNVTVILSGHETPGEGEHKIMDFIRHQRSRPDYDPNTRHCLYGLDADLVMLGMCSHEPHFSLLREEVKFIRNKDKDKKNHREMNPESITFHLLHLSLLRDYIDHEFAELKQNIRFKYDLENIIDDWILMGFLVGNDFIPHIPHFHINKDSLLKLYTTYKRVVPTLDGYLNENGKLNLKRFQIYLNELAIIDYHNFEELYDNFKFLETKSGRKLFGRSNKEVEDTSDFFNLRDFKANGAEKSIDYIDLEADNLIHFEDGDDQIYHSEDESDDNDRIADEFTNHKRHYYMTKLMLPEVTPSVLKQLSHEYIRAIQWNLHYYYDGCVSWCWFFPYHYAPYISDITNFHDIDLTFTRGEPFLPFEQLLAVLPAASKQFLPKAYARLVDTTLQEYYPSDFDSDMNEKQQSWEAIVLIPFIDEEILVNATNNCRNQLTPDEIRRNIHGPHLMYRYSPDNLGRYRSTLPMFEDIYINHANCTKLNQNCFVLPPEKIKRGLCDGVKLGTHFPGFPTLKHINHTFEIRKERVRVFESASMRENMVLTLIPQQYGDARNVAFEYLGKCVFYHWPHLVEGKVCQISDTTFKYTIDRNNQIIDTELTEDEQQKISFYIENATRRYKDRLGIVIGDSEIAVHVNPLYGRKILRDFKGNLTTQKLWSKYPMVVPIQTIVKDIEVHESVSEFYRSPVHPSKRNFIKTVPPKENQWIQQTIPKTTTPKVSTLETTFPKTPKTLMQLVEGHTQTLKRICEDKFGRLPIFKEQSVGPMKAQSMVLQLPNNESFNVLINAYPTMEEVYEHLSIEALKSLNHYDNEQPLLLSCPSFYMPTQTKVSPTRPKIRANHLPRVPKQWIEKPKTQENYKIPESYVESNNRMIEQLRIWDELHSAKSNDTPKSVTPTKSSQFPNQFSPNMGKPVPPSHNQSSSARFHGTPLTKTVNLRQPPPNAFGQSSSFPTPINYLNPPLRPFTRPHYGFPSPQVLMNDTRTDNISLNRFVTPQNNLNPGLQHFSQFPQEYRSKQLVNQTGVDDNCQRSDNKQRHTSPVTNQNFIPLQVSRMNQKKTPEKKNNSPVFNSPHDSVSVISLSSDDTEVTPIASVNLNDSVSDSLNASSGAKPKRRSRTSANFTIQN